MKNMFDYLFCYIYIEPFLQELKAVHIAWPPSILPPTPNNPVWQVCWRKLGVKLLSELP